MVDVNLDDYYTYEQANAQLEKNKKTDAPLDPKYIHSLVRYKKIRVLKMGRASLYLRQDVDNYVVEERGAKSGRAIQQEAGRKSGQPRRGSKK